MIYFKDNRFGESLSPHSLGLRNNMTIPSPGLDENPLLKLQKEYWGAGMYGLGDLSTLVSDPMTWMFQEDMISGVPNILVALGGGVVAWWLMTPGGKSIKRRGVDLGPNIEGIRGLVEH